SVLARNLALVVEQALERLDDLRALGGRDHLRAVVLRGEQVRELGPTQQGGLERGPAAGRRSDRGEGQRGAAGDVAGRALAGWPQPAETGWPRGQGTAGAAPDSGGRSGASSEPSQPTRPG